MQLHGREGECHCKALARVSYTFEDRMALSIQQGYRSWLLKPRF